jgi:hypothetical protein
MCASRAVLLFLFRNQYDKVCWWICTFKNHDTVYDKDWSISSNYVDAILGSGAADAFERADLWLSSGEKEIFGFLHFLHLNFDSEIWNDYFDDLQLVIQLTLTHFQVWFHVELVCGVTSAARFIVFDTKLQFSTWCSYASKDIEDWRVENWVKATRKRALYINRLCPTDMPMLWGHEIESWHVKSTNLLEQRRP